MDQKIVYVEGIDIELTALEFKILVLLFSNIGKVVTREQILENIWDVADVKAELDARNKMYLGNLHPVAIPSSNQAGTVEAPPAEAVAGEDEDLPF